MTLTAHSILKNAAQTKAFEEWISVCLAKEAQSPNDYNGPKGGGKGYSVYWRKRNGVFRYTSDDTSKFLAKPLSEYTIGEVINMKDPYTLHATGRFQCLTKYLSGMAKNVDLGTNDIYSEYNQKLIGYHLILTAGLSLTKYSKSPNGTTYAKQTVGLNFLSGKMPFNEESVLAFQLACSQVWSSISVPYGTQNFTGTYRHPGQSYYPKDGKAHIPVESFVPASIKLRKALTNEEYIEGPAFGGTSISTTSVNNKTSNIATTDTKTITSPSGNTITQYTQTPIRDYIDPNPQPPNSVLEGTVVDDKGTPVPDTTVTITTNKYPNTPFENTEQSNAFRVWLLDKYPEYNDKRKQPGYPPSVLYRVDVPPQPYINSEALKKAWYEKGNEYEEQNNTLKTDKGKITTEQTIVKTDKDGKWFATSQQIISNTSTTVSIFSDGYAPININTILPSGDESNNYTIPKLILSPTPDPVKSASDQLLIEMNESESEQIEKNFLSKVDKISYATIKLNNTKETLKRLLTPFVLKLIAAYGPSLMQAVLKNLPLDEITNLINCPPSAAMIELINQRNKLAKQINNVYDQVRILNKILDASNKVITSLKIGIQIIESIPYPSTGVPPLGLPPLTAGQIQKIGSAKDKIFKVLELTQGTIDIVTTASASLGVVMGIILRLLNTLDSITQYCAQDQNIPFELINNDLNTFVNESTGVSNNTVVNNTQNNNNVYKGFKLELKLDEVNKTQYPRRYAQALTKQGIPVLKTESSFASDPQVLLDQLKFIIDSNSNITAE